MSEITSTNSQLTTHPSGVKLWNGKRYVMITLVSDQSIPNITPIFQKGAPIFDQIYFLHTDKNKPQYEQVCKVLNNYFGELKFSKWDEFGQVDNSDDHVTRRVVTELVEELRTEATGKYELEIVCNWTLGTKPMSVGLLDAARDLNCSTIYVDTQSKSILDPHNIYANGIDYVPIEVNLTVKQYLQAHGLKDIKTGNPHSDWVQAANAIVTMLANPFGNSMDSLDALDGYPNGKGFFQAIRDNKSKLDDKKINREQSKTLNITFNPALAAELANKLRPYELIKEVALTSDNSSVRIELVSQKVLQFLHGNWLEYFVYGKLQEKYLPASTGGIETCLAQGVFFEWPKTQLRSVDNELDVLFTKGTEMVFISCKTGNYYRQEDKNEPIYQLETIARSAGLFSKKTLVICQPKNELPEKFAERANVLNIKLICLEDLPNVAEHIGKLFER